MRENLSARKYQQGLSARKYRCAKISTFTVCYCFGTITNNQNTIRISICDRRNLREQIPTRPSFLNVYVSIVIVVLVVLLISNFVTNTP